VEWPSPFAAEVKRRACERRTNGRHLRVCKRPYGDADRHRRRYQSEPRWSARYEGQCPGPRHSATAPSPLHWAGRSDRHQPPFYIRSQHEHDTIHGSRSPALPQMQPTPEQRAERPRCQTTGDWLLFCTPRSVSVDTACITTHAYHPPITNTHPNNINTWHATPHHTTHRTPHMTPPTHTPPHTPHTLSLPPSPLRHSPLVAHHPPPNTTPHHPSSPPTRPHLHVPEPPCSPLLLEVFTPQPLTARACTRPCRDGHQAGHRNSLVSFSFRVVPTDTHPCSHPQHHCMME